MFQCLKELACLLPFFLEKRNIKNTHTNTHMLRNSVQAVKKNYGPHFNEKWILPRRGMSGQKPAKRVRVVRLTLLRNSQCILFGRKRNDP